MLHDLYMAVPPGFVGEPWVYWLGRLCWIVSNILIGVALGIRLERIQQRKKS